MTKHKSATCPECGMRNVTILTTPESQTPYMCCTNCNWASLKRGEDGESLDEFFERIG